MELKFTVKIKEEQGIFITNSTMSEEYPSKSQNFLMSKEQILSLAENLTYEEKLKLVFALIPIGDFHNYKYREEVVRMALGLPPKKDKTLTGEDLPGLSLKSVKKKKSTIKNPKSPEFEKYVIKPSQNLGTWGRIVADTGYDRKDTISDIWGDDHVILRVKTYYDDNFERLYQHKKNMKLLKEKGYDSESFTIQDLIDFGVKYETLYVDSDEVIVKFPLNSTT
jgi:hypothetical protein